MANIGPLNLEAVQDEKIAALNTFAGKFRASRAAIPSFLGSAMTDITLKFDTPFADAAYTVAIVIEQPATISGIVVSFLVVAKTAASVTVRVKNLSLLAFPAVINVIAIHD